MKKNILVKIGERAERRTRLIPAEYNEAGELIRAACEEAYTVTVPIMEARNVEMSADEAAEMERLAAAAQEPEQGAGDRVAALEAQVAALTALLTRKGG